MFSLDKFYQILHDNLLSQFVNNDTMYFHPFGTYDKMLQVRNKSDISWYTLPVVPVGPKSLCYFLDQEPWHEFTPIIGSPELAIQTKFDIQNPNTKHVFSDMGTGPRRLFIIANSEKSEFKKKALKERQYYDWYYFYHGFAALDWYRNFQYVRPDLFDGFNKVFICYNHLTSNNRSYRLHLVSNLISQGLIQHGHVSMPIDTWEETIRDTHCLLSTKAKIKVYQTLKLLDAPLVIDIEKPHGSLSAETDFNRWTSAFWHIVTETVYFFPKLHLTEKIFKPIVSQRPFILVAAPGNLAYLKSYGFQTFDRWIDESYDQETDHYVRIEMITKEIEKLCALSKAELDQMYAEMKEILVYNYNHFYGEFKRIIVNELVDNFEGILMQFNNGRQPNNHSRYHYRYELSREYLEEVKQRLLK